MYTPPTKLTQIYYKCVMSPEEAWFNSLGIAQANSVVYTSLFFSVLMFFLVNYLNYIKKIVPKVRTLQKVAVEEAKAKAEDKANIDLSVIQFRALVKDMLDGTIGFKYDVAAAVERHKKEANMGCSNEVGADEMLDVETTSVEMTNVEMTSDEISSDEMTNVDEEISNPLQHRVYV